MYDPSKLMPARNSSVQIAIQENGDPRNSPFWHSRGYLPHFEGNEIPQMVTFHLSDSLPRTALRRMEAHLKIITLEKRDITRRKALDALTDAGHGSCLMASSQNAEMVESSLLNFDSFRYRLFAWIVMPNHVHALLQPLNDWTVAKIVSSWKKFTARRIAVDALPIWHREYWDRYIRNQNHFAKAIDYIHSNPVKAGLVNKAENWPWSSARFSLGSPIS